MSFDQGFANLVFAGFSEDYLLDLDLYGLQVLMRYLDAEQARQEMSTYQATGMAMGGEKEQVKKYTKELQSRVNPNHADDVVVSDQKRLADRFGTGI